MSFGRSKFIAIATGIFSIVICLIYLILISVFDFRTFINDQLSNIS